MIKSKKFLTSTELKPLVPSANNPANPLSKTCTAFLVSVLLLWSVTGCAIEATFPSHALKDSMERIAKEDYDLDVIARVRGETIGVMYYTENLLDETGTQMTDRPGLLDDGGHASAPSSRSSGVMARP